MRAYTGIGSRVTPPDVIVQMQKLAKFLAKQGFTLRSGGAKGADTAFETGCDAVQGQKRIFLPWQNFNGNPSKLYGVTRGARDLAAKYHPNWEFLLPSVRDLMGRNSYQILELDLQTQTEFVCCWTKDGKVDGGTGQALRIANHLGIPIINFGSMKLPEIEDRIRELVSCVPSKPLGVSDAKPIIPPTV